MKKTISVILAIMMMLSLFTITANAGNGPSDKQDEFGYRASIYFIEDDPMLDTPQTYPVFADNTASNDILEGATYDKDTNTLTLTDFNRSDLRLELNMMGEDFKINVVGDVVLSRLLARGEAYDCKITFTGTGKITINPTREHSSALTLRGDTADFTLHVDASVNTVKFLSCESAITFMDVNHPDKNTLFSDGDTPITEFDGWQDSDEVQVKIPGARLGDRVEHGYELGVVNQQPGTTAGMNNQFAAVSLGMGFVEDENGDTTDPDTGRKGFYREMFQVEKFVYNEKLGGFIPDPTFSASPMSEIDLNEEGYFFVTQPGSEKETIEYYAYDDASGEMEKKEGYVVDNDDDGLMYVTDVDLDALSAEEREFYMGKAYPIVYNDQTQRYEITPVAGFKEFNGNNFETIGLHYRYKEEKRPFYIQELVTGEYDKYEHTGEGGIGLHAVEMKEPDDSGRPQADIYDYDENDTITIDGKEYYILYGPSNYGLDMITPVMDQVAGYYNWFYEHPDYIRVSQQIVSGGNETGSEEYSSATQDMQGGQDVTGGTMPEGTTEPSENSDPTRDTSAEAATDATETTTGAEGNTDPTRDTSETTTDAAENTTAAGNTEATTLYPVLPEVPTIPYTTVDPNATTAPATSDPNATTAPATSDPNATTVPATSDPGEKASDSQPATNRPSDDAIGGGDADDKAPIDEIKKGVSEKQVDKFVTKQKTEDDVKGSIFNLLCLRQKKVNNKAITVQWNKVKGAKYYVLYGSKCGTKKGEVPPFKKIKTLKGNSYTQKKLKKGTYYKYMVVALDKNKKAVTSSKNVHIVTTGGKNGNDKSVTVNSKSVSLNKGKTYQISAKQNPKSKSKTVRRHRNIKYESTNKKIAKVSGKGKITAKKKGTAYIYVYAQNGLYSKIKVTVK